MLNSPITCQFTYTASAQQQCPHAIAEVLDASRMVFVGRNKGLVLLSHLREELQVDDETALGERAKTEAKRLADRV